MATYEEVLERTQAKNDYYFTKLPWDKGSREAHRADQQRLDQEFRDDLLSAFKTLYPWLNEGCLPTVFGKAWEDGHANGYSEIFYHFENLCEFLDNFLKEMK